MVQMADSPGTFFLEGAPPKEDLRVLIYNIRYGTGTGWHYHLPFPFAGCLHPTTYRMKKIASFLESQTPDILGLLEVDFGSFRHNFSCQAQSMAASLGMTFQGAIKYAPDNLATRLPLFRHQGNAVLSRLPAVSSRVHQMSRGMKRAVLEADFGNFTFFLVHLPLGKKARHQQLRDLVRLVKGAKKPVIFGGDCNTFGGEGELREFLEASNLRPTDVRNCPTYSSRTPLRQLDFIFTTPEFSVRSFEVPSSDLSDHLPLVCDLTLC